MEITINISNEKKQYVENLILYINDVKPFHTKLKNVSEDVNCVELLRMKVDYSLAVIDVET